MEYQLYHEENLNGGKSHQLGIFPEGAVIEARKFIWMSSVCEDSEENGERALKGRKFSTFENHLRNLVVLDGNIILSVGEERAERLGRYAQSQFDGATKTESFGFLKGFILTTKKGSTADVNIFELKEKYTLNLGDTKTKESAEDGKEYTHGSFLLYCSGGFAIVVIEGKRVPLEKGAQLVLNYSKYEEVEIILLGNGIFIMSEVFYDYDEEEYKEEERIQIVKEKKEESTEREEQVKPARRDQEQQALALYDESKSPIKPGFIGKYKFVLSISNLFIRGKGVVRVKKQNVLYSNLLKKKIGLVRNSFLPFFIGIVTIIIGLTIGTILGGTKSYLWAVIIWAIAFVAFINPMTYYLFLPKPLWKHIRYANSLSEDEIPDFGAGEVEENRTEKILRKYKNAGKQKYD